MRSIICDFMKGYGVLKGIGVFLIGALVWLNALYEWLDWASFTGIVLMLIGIKLMLFYGYQPKKKKR